ncbi:hypothetical protein BGZ76_002641, partial [Entomortierella beljakovae]
MAYYNSTSPKQNNATPNSYVTSTPTYISSPFDDDPPIQQQQQHQSPYNNPYNPDYMPNSPYSPKNDTFNQSSHSTQEHSLSPGFSEKALPASNNNLNNNGQSYPMQQLTASHSPYEDQYNNNHRDSYYRNDQNYYNGYDED